MPRLDLGFLAKPEWGGTSPSAVTGVWSVMTALTCAILTVLALNLRRIPDLRATMDAGVNASALPAISVASLVGFGAVVAAMPAFTVVRDAVLGIGGGPLVSLAVATNTLAALTGSASGGLTIALDALGPTYLERAAQIGMDPALLHRVAVIGSGTLDSLPHNGAVVTLLAVCGSTHTESYVDLFMVAIVGAKRSPRSSSLDPPWARSEAGRFPPTTPPVFTKERGQNMKTMDRRKLLGAIVCGVAAGIVLAPAALEAMPIDSRVRDGLPDAEKAQVVVVNPRRQRRRRWVCWWRRGRRVCGWRWV